MANPEKQGNADAKEAPKAKSDEEKKAEAKGGMAPGKEAPKARAEDGKKAQSSEPAKAGQPAAPKNGAVTLQAPPEAPAIDEMLVRLDTYDDIFSDFDPRPHAQRELSEDLLKELGRRYRENPKGDLEVSFYIPAAMRTPKEEEVIRKRLKRHFMHERGKVRAQIKEHRQRALGYAGVGFLLLLVDLLLTLWMPDELWVKVLEVLLTPAGWFSLWTGLERLAELPYNLKSQQEFVDKFAKCSYMFLTDDRE